MSASRTTISDYRAEPRRVTRALRHRALTILLGCGLPALAAAQTTGVPFVNDYTIGGFGSGATSCNAITLGSGTYSFTVTSSPNLAVVYFIDLCPCSPCWLPLPSVTCTIPTTACFGSNQSIDIDLSSACPVFAFPGVTDAFGISTVTLPYGGNPPFSTQVAILGHPTCVSSLGLLVTQAHQVN